jgi:hypothetical protein
MHTQTMDLFQGLTSITVAQVWTSLVISVGWKLHLDLQASRI